ncbi:MAG: hypothetical protein AAGD01_20630 [Acidobacteriota bacterium]
MTKKRTPDTAAEQHIEEREPAPLYFFPEDSVSDKELREILAGDDQERRLWALSHLLRFAQWEDIWQYVSREEVREHLPNIEMTEKLRAAYARMLGIEELVGSS